MMVETSRPDSPAIQMAAQMAAQMTAQVNVQVNVPWQRPCARCGVIPSVRGLGHGVTPILPRQAMGKGQEALKWAGEPPIDPFVMAEHLIRSVTLIESNLVQHLRYVLDAAGGAAQGMRGPWREVLAFYEVDSQRAGLSWEIRCVLNVVARRLGRQLQRAEHAIVDELDADPALQRRVRQLWERLATLVDTEGRAFDETIWEAPGVS